MEYNSTRNPNLICTMYGRYQGVSRKVKNFRKDAHTAEISIPGYDPLVALSALHYLHYLHIFLFVSAIDLFSGENPQQWVLTAVYSRYNLSSDEYETCDKWQVEPSVEPQFDDYWEMLQPRVLVKDACMIWQVLGNHYVILASSYFWHPDGCSPCLLCPTSPIFHPQPPASSPPWYSASKYKYTAHSTQYSTVQLSKKVVSSRPRCEGRLPPSTGECLGWARWHPRPRHGGPGHRSHWSVVPAPTPGWRHRAG